MDPVTQRKWIQLYARDLLVSEVDPLRGKGEAARVAKKYKISQPYLSNLRQEPPSRLPGDDLIEKIAKAHGMTWDKLVEAALGKHKSSPQLKDSKR